MIEGFLILWPVQMVISLSFLGQPISNGLGNLSADSDSILAVWE